MVERIGGLQFLGARSLNTGDSSSLTSAASVVWRSASAASDDQLLPAEYERVIANLTKRGEKGHMILALSEVRLSKESGILQRLFHRPPESS